MSLPPNPLSRRVLPPSSEPSFREDEPAGEDFYSDSDFDGEESDWLGLEDGAEGGDTLLDGGLPPRPTEVTPPPNRERAPLTPPLRDRRSYAPQQPPASLPPRSLPRSPQPISVANEGELQSVINHHQSGVEPVRYHEPDNIVRAGDPFEEDEELAASAAEFFKALNDDDYTEIIMNGPNEILGEKGGVRYHFVEISFRDTATYHRFINEKLLPHTSATKRISTNTAFIESQLTLDSPNPNEAPLYARVHIMCPPVVQDAKATIAKKSRISLTLDDLVSFNSMSREMGEFLKVIARGRVTTVFSGTSGAGKTTMVQAMSHYFDQNDRVIIVEDTPELNLPLGGALQLAASTRDPGQKASDVITIEWLVAATNRMRPDRIIIGEILGAEANEFLVAANSGADGSMTTVHAHDPRGALNKLTSLAMKADGVKSESSVSKDIANTVQLIVQLSKIEGGRKIVSQIEEISSTVNSVNHSISSGTIFAYNRERQKFECKGRPSDQLVTFLKQRGVTLDNSWFN